MDFESALGHINKCLSEKYICPFCPEFEVLGCNMDEHLKVCPNYEEKCPSCMLTVKRNDFKDHDCFTALKKAYLIKERQLTETKAEFGLPDSNFQPMCNKKHLQKA